MVFAEVVVAPALSREVEGAVVESCVLVARRGWVSGSEGMVAVLSCRLLLL